jgi:hypothetical protein
VALRDILGRLVEQFEPTGSSIQMHRAIQAGRPMVMAEPETLIYLVDESLGRHLTQFSTRSLGTVRSLRGGKRGDDPRQTNMFEAFGLRPRYALDTEERDVKRTDWLSRAEVNKLIAIREAQLVADTRHLEKLRYALDTVAPLWDLNPDLTFGQVIELYMRNQRESA